METNQNRKGLNGFHLRLLAMITMLTDHIAILFLGRNIWVRGVGRIAFLLYAFLLADGFLHIKDTPARLTKHISALAVLAVVAEGCYDLMEQGLQFTTYMDTQSVIITLIIGYLALLATEHLGDNKPALVCVYILSGFANYAIKGNFNLVGPWIIIAFYWYLKKAADRPWLQRFLILCSIMTLYLPVYFWGWSKMAGWQAWCEAVQTHVPWIIFHYVTAGIIASYSGKLGYHSKTFSRIYTWFYPAHALLLGIVAWVVMG